MTGTASAWTPFIIGFLTIWSIGPAIAYRIFDPNDTRPAYFEPYHPGFVGISGDPANTRRLRVNEGNQFTRTQPNVFEGVNPRRKQKTWCFVVQLDGLHRELPWDGGPI